MATNKTQPKILLFGSGAIGTIYSYLLLKASCSVIAVCRSNYEAAKSNGFHIDSDVYGKGIHITPKIVRTVSEAQDDGPYDYVIVSSKALPEVKTSETIAPAITPGKTTIVLVQNGIGIEEEYSSLFPSNPLLSCVVYLPATQTSPGHIHMGDNERIEIGPYPSTAHENPSVKSSADKFTSLLKTGGSNATYHASIQEKRWYKLLLNAPWNPICALTLSRDLAYLASSSSAEPVIRGVSDEVIAISKALGYESIDSEAGEKVLGIVLSRKGKKGEIGVEPSMLVDILWARKMEHEVILGNPVRIARKYNIPVPRMEMLYALTKALDAATQGRKPGKSLDAEDVAALEHGT